MHHPECIPQWIGLALTVVLYAAVATATGDESSAQDITGLRQQQPADSPSTSAQAKTGTALLDSWLDDRLPNDQGNPLDEVDPVSFVLEDSDTHRFPSPNIPLSSSDAKDDNKLEDAQSGELRDLQAAGENTTGANLTRTPTNPLTRTPSRPPTRMPSRAPTQPASQCIDFNSPGEKDPRKIWCCSHYVTHYGYGRRRFRPSQTIAMGSKNISLTLHQVTSQFNALECKTSIVAVYLNDNSLSGPIQPEFLRGFTHLEQLRLHNNQLSGWIPVDFLEHCTRLKHVNLSKNKFSGAIPVDFLKSCTQLMQVNLSKNKLRGSISVDFLKSCTKLKHVFLHSNQLSGAIPVDFLKSCTQLMQVNLSKNKFSGAIPVDFLKSCTQLMQVNLSKNKLKGAIPADFLIDCKQLRFLDLRKNQLSGQISAEFLQSCNFLIALYLSDNQLIGYVPPNLAFSSPYLAVLHLDGNRRLQFAKQSCDRKFKLRCQYNKGRDNNLKKLRETCPHDSQNRWTLGEYGTKALCMQKADCNAPPPSIAGMLFPDGCAGAVDGRGFASKPTCRGGTDFEYAWYFQCCTWAINKCAPRGTLFTDHRSSRDYSTNCRDHADARYYSRSSSQSAQAWIPFFADCEETITENPQTNLLSDQITSHADNSESRVVITRRWGLLGGTFAKILRDETFDTDPWLLIDLGRTMPIVGLVTLGGTLQVNNVSQHYWVTEYRVMARNHPSASGSHWLPVAGGMTFEGNFDSTTKVYVGFEAQIAQLVKIIPTDYYKWIAMRVDVLVHKEPSPIKRDCSWVEAATSTRIPTRSPTGRPTGTPTRMKDGSEVAATISLMESTWRRWSWTGRYTRSPTGIPTYSPTGTPHASASPAFVPPRTRYCADNYDISVEKLKTTGERFLEGLPLTGCHSLGCSQCTCPEACTTCLVNAIEMDKADKCQTLAMDKNDTKLTSSGMPAHAANTTESATCAELTENHLCTDPTHGNRVTRACPQSCEAARPGSRKFACTVDISDGCAYSNSELKCMPDFSHVYGAEDDAKRNLDDYINTKCPVECINANKKPGCAKAHELAVYGMLSQMMCKRNGGLHCEKAYGRAPWACYYNERGHLCPSGDTFTLQCFDRKWVPPFAKRGVCYEAYLPSFPNCSSYISAGYTCVGDYCAGVNPGGSRASCATYKGEGFTVDRQTGRCTPIKKGRSRTRLLQSEVAAVPTELEGSIPPGCKINAYRRTKKGKQMHPLTDGQHALTCDGRHPGVAKGNYIFSESCGCHTADPAYMTVTQGTSDELLQDLLDTASEEYSGTNIEAKDSAGWGNGCTS